MAACAAVVIGCGGGGGGGSRSTGGSNPTPGSGMAVQLDQNYGIVQVQYLTGQGRAPGDLYLQITRQTISNGDGVDIVNRDSIAPLNLRLDGYQTVAARLNVPFGITTAGRPDARNFNTLTFDPSDVLTDDGTGRLSVAGSLPDNLPVALDARIRAFAGRTSVVQLRVSSQTFFVDPNTGGYTFDEAYFKDLNYSTDETDPDGVGRVSSRFSDFVRFPLTYVPVELRPDLATSVDGDVLPNGAQYVYFSGDNVALSSAAGGAGSTFQEVGPEFDQIVVGKWSEGSAGGFLGTYDLRENNPGLPEGGPTSLISIYGNFRDYNTVLTGGGTFEIVMFPNSGDTYTFEGNAGSGVRGRLGDIVAIVRNANNQITNMYYGGVDFGDKTFELFPIRGLGADPADPDIANARLTGTIGNLRDRTGGETVNYAAVRSFTYTFGSSVGSGDTQGFLTTGNATVFRK